MRTLIFFLVIAGIQAPGPFVYEQRLGIARWRDGRGCLAVFNSTLTTGTRVALVDQPESPDAPSVKEGRIVERLSEPCDNGLNERNEKGVAPSSYRVATGEGVSPPERIVFAILDQPGPVVVRDGKVEADLDGDKATESFRTCLSAENVHFMVWTGPPGTGTPRWHGHYYVGYDMTPSCNERDIAGMEALRKGRTGLLVEPQSH